LFGNIQDTEDTGNREGVLTRGSFTTAVLCVAVSPW